MLSYGKIRARGAGYAEWGGVCVDIAGDDTADFG